MNLQDKLNLLTCLTYCVPMTSQLEYNILPAGPETPSKCRLYNTYYKITDFALSKTVTSRTWTSINTPI